MLKVTRTAHGKRIVLITRNIPLAIFYVLCGIIVLFFGNLFQDKFNAHNVFIIELVLIGLLAMSIAMAFLTKAVIEIDSNYLNVFEGVFFIGIKKRTATKYIRDVYVQRKSIESWSYQYRPRPGIIKTRLQIDGAPSITILKNKFSTDTLTLIQREIEETLNELKQKAR
jgi:hypothetical protein